MNDDVGNPAGQPSVEMSEYLQMFMDETEEQLEDLVEALAPGGYLVVGPSEGIYDMLDPLRRHSPFLYQKPHEAGSLAP